MMQNGKTSVFRGAATALATPFTADGVDFPALFRMIDYQIAGGIDALVLCGTTGEAPTLTATEYEETVARATEQIGGRVPCVVGCGSNDTRTAAARAKFAAAHGADALLVVTPYYNKGTPDGLRRHYETVADAGGLPVILYHVPGRTGVRLSCEAILALCRHPLIRAVKEASGDIDLFADLAAADAELTLYTGNDAETLPSLALGGDGVISVLSNLLPGEVARLCRLCMTGDFPAARALHARLLPLTRLLFRETNPAPLKWALALRGQCESRLRLPLSDVAPALRTALANELENW